MAELNRRQALISAYERYKTAAEALQEELRLSFSQPGFPFDRDLTLTQALVNFTFKNQYILTRLERLVLGCYVAQPRVRRLSESICARMNAAGVREQPRTLDSTSQQLENLKINEETQRAIMARPQDRNKAASRDESTQQEVLQANAPTEEMEVAESSDSAKNAPTEDTNLAESSDSAKNAPSEDTKVAESSDSANNAPTEKTEVAESPDSTNNVPIEKTEVAESLDSANINAPTEDTKAAVSPDSANKTRSDDTAAQDMASPNLDLDKTD